MRVNLLGPVTAQVGDGTVDLGGTKQRAVFALLAMSAGRVVPMDRLIDDLWHEEPPARATVTLRAYVSRLRRALESAALRFGADVPEIRTQPPGWVLTLPVEQVDLMVFRGLVDQARQLLSHGDDGLSSADLLRGCAMLVDALGLWHGELLSDLTSVPAARAEAVRAEDERLAAVELLLETRLRLGEHHRVVDEARALVGRHPFRERGFFSDDVATDLPWAERTVRITDDRKLDLGAIRLDQKTINLTGRVRGHEKVPTGGQLRSPLVAV